MGLPSCRAGGAWVGFPGPLWPSGNAPSTGSGQALHGLASSKQKEGGRRVCGPGAPRTQVQRPGSGGRPGRRKGSQLPPSVPEPSVTVLLRLLP